MGVLADDLVLFVTVLFAMLFAIVRPVCLWSAPVELGWRRAAAVPPALLAIALAVYVRAEDDYRADGRARWDVYGSEANATVTVAIVAAVLAAGAGYTSYRRPSVAGVAALAGAVAAALAFAARLQMTN
jgi:hypothetical protein